MIQGNNYVVDINYDYNSDFYFDINSNKLHSYVDCYDNCNESYNTSIKCNMYDKYTYHCIIHIFIINEEYLIIYPKGLSKIINANYS